MDGRGMEAWMDRITGGLLGGRACISPVQPMFEF